MEYTLYLKQKPWSFWGRYEVKNEKEEIVFFVEGKKSWLRRQVVLNSKQEEIGRLELKWSIPARFSLFAYGKPYGDLERKIHFFKTELFMTINGWRISTPGLGWTYEVKDSKDNLIAIIQKELWHLTDYFVIHYFDVEDALSLVLIGLALDCIHDSRKNN